MKRDLVLLDASAFWRLRSARLDTARRREVAGWVARGIVAASTPLLLETRADREPPPVDPGELPLLWVSERAERRAADLQEQLRAAHQHLGVPPLDYLVAAVAEDHSASILHYDRDFELLASHTDLAAEVEALAPLGTLPWSTAKAIASSGPAHPQHLMRCRYTRDRDFRRFEGIRVEDPFV